MPRRWRRCASQQPEWLPDIPSFLYWGEPGEPGLIRSPATSVRHWTGFTGVLRFFPKSDDQSIPNPHIDPRLCRVQTTVVPGFAVLSHTMSTNPASGTSRCTHFRTMARTVRRFGTVNSPCYARPNANAPRSSLLALATITARRAASQANPNRIGNRARISASVLAEICSGCGSAKSSRVRCRARDSKSLSEAAAHS